jgi:hypothetical protein
VSDFLFVAVDPGVKVSLIESPTFVEANFSQPVADDFLFEAVARQTAVCRSLVEVEHPLPRRSAV